MEIEKEQDVQLGDPITPLGVPIFVNSHKIHQTTQVPGGALYEEDASRTNYLLMHFNDRLTPEQEKELKAMHVQFCRKIPGNTWVVRYEPVDLVAIRELPYVIYANPFHEGLTIDPALEAQLALASKALAPMSVDAVRIHQGLLQMASVHTQADEPKLYHVFIVLHEKTGKTPAQLIDELVSNFQIPRERLALEVRAVMAELRVDEIRKIAQSDDVGRIEEFRESVPDNHLAREVISVRHAWSYGLLPRGNHVPIDGRGEVVVVADSGLDVGFAAAPPNNTVPANTHPFFTNRVLKLDARATSRPNRADDTTGHGTHVAGTVLGAYQPPGINGPIKLFGRLDGAAPRASLIAQAIFRDPVVVNGRVTQAGSLDLANLQPQTITKLFMDPYNGYPDATLQSTVTPARIHTSSWGTASKLTAPRDGYNVPAETVDTIIRSNPDYFILRSAGNDGDTWAPNPPGSGQIQSWAVAKNSLTVGACYSEQTVNHPGEGGGNNPQFWIKYQPNGWRVSHDSVPHFSNRGPPKDNHARIIKPDLVAPGVAIYSAESAARMIPRHEFGISLDPWCAFSSGTSMATPMVAGCAAMLRQTLRTRGYANPSAALLKALFVNGAEDLSLKYPRGQLIQGNEDFNEGIGEPVELEPRPLGRAPDDIQGFGRVDIAESVDNVLDTQLAGFIDIQQPAPNVLDLRLQRTGSVCVPFASIIPRQPPAALPGRTLGNIKVTLAYTDVPGEGLQNEITLSLEFPGQPGYNTAVDSNSQDNRLARMAGNNVQKLEVQSISMINGDVNVMIKVRAVELVSAEPQAYAIAWKIWYS